MEIPTHPRERTFYVTNIANNMTEDDIRKQFQRAGSIEKVIFKIADRTLQHAIVVFSRIESVTSYFDTVDPLVINGQTVCVRYLEDFFFLDMTRSQLLSFLRERPDVQLSGSEIRRILRILNQFYGRCVYKCDCVANETYYYTSSDDRCSKSMIHVEFTPEMDFVSDPLPSEARTMFDLNYVLEKINGFRLFEDDIKFEGKYTDKWNIRYVSRDDLRR